jgi:hypothetical protein
LNSGTISTANGNICTTRNDSNSLRLPGKRKRLTAYPVVADRNTAITVVSSAISTEFSTQARKSPC